MKKINLPSLIFVLSALSVMAISFWTRTSLPIPRESSRLLGMFVFLSGMTLFTWAGLYLKCAFYGSVEPETGQIIKDGPYRWVRHPLYLSMIVSLAGFSLMVRSFWGIVSVFALFLPSLIYRAKLEEQALDHKYGSKWQKYARKTAFLVPFIY